MIPVKGHPGLYRDENTNAIVNCSTEEYTNYVEMKKVRMDKNNKILELEEEINELKKLVHQLLNK